MINLSGADSLAEHRYPIAVQIGERGFPPGGREHDRLPDEHAIVRRTKPAAALADRLRGSNPRRGSDPRRLRLRVAAFGHRYDEAAETSRCHVHPDGRPVAVQDAEIVAITVPPGAQHGVPGKADSRHSPSPEAQPRLRIGRYGEDGGEADPDVTVEAPDLLAQGEMDY